MAYWSNAELKRNRSVQDRLLAERHRQWDLQAQDRTAKFERPRFAVVGEGSRSAQEAYRKNYGLIDWAA